MIRRLRKSNSSVELRTWSVEYLDNFITPAEKRRRSYAVPEQPENAFIVKVRGSVFNSFEISDGCDKTIDLYDKVYMVRRSVSWGA